MSEINKKSLAPLNTQQLRQNYQAGIGSRDGQMLLGSEREIWFFDRDAAQAGRVQMMSPQQSQAAFAELAQQPSTVQVAWEANGTRSLNRLPGAPVVMVANPDGNVQLEMCGVFELATAPDSIANTPQQLAKQQAAFTQLGNAATKAGVVASSLAVPASVTPADCLPNRVQRERLLSEWAKFESEGADSPGLRTMGLSASVQVSLSYRDPAEAAEIMTLGNLLSPILYSVFANTSGYIEGQPSSIMPRPNWWQQHNKRAPRAGIPEPILARMFAPSAPEEMLDGWIDYVKTVPMVYHIGADGSPRFATSPSFNELSQQGLGTAANFSLAESLVWPDVKLIGGQRIELRAPDSGPWQQAGLTVLAATLFSDTATRQELIRELKQSNNLGPDQLQLSLGLVANMNFKTPYGTHTVADQLQPLSERIQAGAKALDLPDASYSRLLEVMETCRSDFLDNRACNIQGARQADLRALAL